MSLVEVRGLNVWFDLPDGRLHAVRGVTFSVSSGERMGLVGESGCGKSTAMLAMMGLLPATATVAGEVLIDGQNILRRGERSVKDYRWKYIAMVPQAAMNALNPLKNIRSQVVEPMELHHVAEGAEAKRRAEELLETVGLSRSTVTRYPHELSGGMRQRAAIAMALACKPKILLADEPTTALDVMIQAQVLQVLVDAADNFDFGLVLVTHDLGVVAEVCHRAAVMYAGEIVENAPVAALYASPRHPYTRLLLAATPDAFDDAEVVTIPGSPPRLDQPLKGCPFRPRCDRAFDKCVIAPQLLPVYSLGHLAACHLNTQQVSEAAPVARSTIG